MMAAVPVDPTDGAQAGVALATAFRTHWSELVGLARLLGRRDAEEVVQEAFVRTYAGWSRVRTPSDPVPYLRRSVVNLARGRARRDATASRSHLLLAPRSSTTEDEAVAGEDRREVFAALQALPRRQRECVVLRYFLDCSTDEAAAALGISAGAVKTHLHRALAAMGTRLEGSR